MATATLAPESEKSLRSSAGMSRDLTPSEAVETLRGLSGIRLSVKTDETTSPERQREANDRVSRNMGIDFTAPDGSRREAEDLDVSASKTGPFDRPELREWLARPDEFDVIVWWRFDRAIRNMGDMFELAKWAKAHRKMLVFAESFGGGPTLVFDFRNPMNPLSELMMMVLAFAAQVESQSISDRVTGAKAAMRGMELRWAGGHVPYGYMPEAVKGEWTGWTLVQDPKAVKVLHFIIREILKGRAINAIAWELTEKRVPAPADHQKLRKAEPGSAEEQAIWAKLRPWRPGTIWDLFEKLNLIGWKTHKGVPVRHDDGSPVMMTAEPILTREEYDHVNSILGDRGVDPVERKDTHALLLRVALCIGCGSRMYLGEIDPETGDGWYRCGASSRGARCTSQGLVKRLWVEEYVRRTFLAMAGGIEFTETRTIPGYDPGPELRSTLAEFREHQKQQGRQKSKTAAAEWQKHADALDNRLAVLEQAEKVEPTTETIGTGKTFAQEWQEANDDGRRKLLLEAGVTVLVHKGIRGNRKPIDDEARIIFAMKGDFDEAVEAVGDPVEHTGERPAPDPRGKLRIVHPDGIQELPERATLTQAA